MTADVDDAGTDLGRRIAEQRAKAGLTIEEAAERAGMSAGYLAYLESSTAPNPTQAGLMRLAAALGTSPAKLSGAGLNRPPGQRSAAQQAKLEELSPAQCRAHVAAGGVGRFLFAEPGRGPVAIPVNFRMDGDDVIFRTAHDGVIAAGVRQPQVSFDVDHLDETSGEGWSVLMSGSARLITEPAELERVHVLGVEPWAGGSRPDFVRIVVTEVTGRRIRVAG